MPQIALRGVSERLHRDLREAAARNRRSMNSEIPIRLEESFVDRVLDVDELLERIRADRRRIGPVDASEATLRAFKDEGRP